MRVGRRADFVMRQKHWRRPSLTIDFVDRRKLLMPMTFAGRRDDFVTREKRILLVAFSRRTGRIGAGGGNRLQQEVAEFGEGGGFLARDAALREQAEHLGESAVHAGGGSEIAAGGIEFGKIETGADDVAPG